MLSHALCRDEESPPLGLSYDLGERVPWTPPEAIGAMLAPIGGQGLDKSIRVDSVSISARNGERF